MRVMCINDDFVPSADVKREWATVKYLGEYDVVEEQPIPINQKPGYILAGHELFVYAQECFVRISDDPAEIEIEEAEFELVETA